MEPNDLDGRGYELYTQAMRLLENDKDLFFVEHLAAEMGISKGTFYNHKLHELNDIKEALVKNKQTKKKKLLRQWSRQDQPATLQLALYKILGSRDERRVLSTSYQETKELQPELDIDVSKLSDDELETLEKIYAKIGLEDDGKDDV